MWSKTLTKQAPATNAIDPADFTTTIDNSFLPLVPGTTFVYEDKAAHTIDYVVVTHKTKIVDGVTCVQVHDYELANGQLSEDTRDWFAQDSSGNVWYFGENSHQYEPGNPDPVGHEGSWQAGKHGAEPGIVMEANPQAGDVYAEENAAPAANDMAEVQRLNAHKDVVYGDFGHLLKTRNFSPLEPDVTEHKWYAAGIGNVLSTDNEDAYEQLVLITLSGTHGKDTLVGFAGRDTMLGRGGGDALSGGDGGDLMYGGPGGDTLAGNAGGDVLNGGAGDDTLAGGRGRDVLIGGSGDDTLTGGPNADTFVFTLQEPAARDVITDYSQAQGDTIAVPGGSAGVAYDSHKGGWHIVLNDGHVIVLEGVHDSNHDGHILDNITIVGATG